jgi:hypothetical protein
MGKGINSLIGKTFDKKYSLWKSSVPFRNKYLKNGEMTKIIEK